MNDDFRMTIELAGDHGALDELLERVREGEVEYEASNRLGDRVVVSRGDDRIFLYAGSGVEANAAAAAVIPLLPRFHLEPAGEPRLERWHPEAEEWRDGDAPLPTSPSEVEAEQARTRERERAESAAAGHPEWEVRIELADADAARALEEQLESEGLDVQRRSHYVLAGAPSEDDAQALADRLRAEAPPGARLEVQGTGQEWWAVLHPFSVFGGLGG